MRASVARAKFSGSRGIDEAHLDALVLQRVGEQVPCAAVEIGRGDDVVAGAREILHRESRGRLTAGQRQPRDAAFERGDALLQHIVGRVADARVDVAEFLQREQIGGVLGAVELIGGRLIDRHGDGAGRRIGAPAGMQGERFRLRDADITVLPGRALLRRGAGFPSFDEKSQLIKRAHSSTSAVACRSSASSAPALRRIMNGPDQLPTIDQVPLISRPSALTTPL